MHGIRKAGDGSPVNSHGSRAMTQHNPINTSLTIEQAARQLDIPTAVVVQALVDLAGLLKIDRPNQVWATDITYIPMAKGFAYLVAIMDWASRKVLAWRISNTLTTDFCVDALQEAIGRYGKPEIFNTDQGSQFTSEDFTGILKENGIQISMDGKGRWVDNVFVERLWRSVKYENVYLRAYESMAALREGIKDYFLFYNTKRTHQSLAKQTPDEVYFNDNGLKEAA